MDLYPRLDVLGTISSFGKTTWACHLADQLAKAGGVDFEALKDSGSVEYKAYII